jgi:hypothetical protein
MKKTFPLDPPIRWKGVSCREARINPETGVVQFHVRTEITNFWAHNYPEESAAAARQYQALQQGQSAGRLFS